MVEWSSVAQEMRRACCPITDGVSGRSRFDRLAVCWQGTTVSDMIWEAQFWNWRMRVGNHGILLAL